MSASNPFTTVRTEGGLLPPDLLSRIVAGDRDLGGVGPTDYGLAATDRLGEAASRAWNRTKGPWQSFTAMREILKDDETGVTETREQWIFPLLRELGFERPEFRAAAEEIGGRRYAIQHRSGPVPLHVVSFRQNDLDKSVAAGAGQPRTSPHALVQEYLNRSEESLYGVVTNGFNLRLLRDNQSLSRLAYVDFDLTGMFEGGVYADFVLLFLTLHRSRLPKSSETASDCWLEKWRDKAESQGTRALGELRTGIERAIEALGNGLLAHPANTQLRADLAAGSLTTLDFYAELLRVIYRLIFLFVAEERGLLHPDDAEPRMKARYRDHYSATRLRDVARRHRTDERHDDLWRSLRVTFDILAGRRTALDLVALDGLFAEYSCPHLDTAQVANNALAEAVLQLSNVRVAKRVRRVNYRDIGAEELGGVYEGLLDRQPRVTVDAPPGKQFELIGSGERKSTGSYYTPDSLVQELIKSALVPVIEDRVAKAGRSREAQEQALLSIAVCDTACGSGHFLLAAARRLGAELARIRAEDREPSPKDQRAAQRDVVRHCLYGVDVNPLSVDLCRLSLWMESYDSGRPLSFLDHHVKVGNSLIGATAELVAEGIPDDAFDPVGDDEKEFARRIKKRNREEKRQRSFVTSSGELAAEWSAATEHLSSESTAIAALPDTDADDVLDARQRYERFTHEQVDPLRKRLDAWTAAFFWTLKSSAPLPPTSADLAGRAVPLTPDQRSIVSDLASRNRFFHWQLEFPEVFAQGGFDCVLGNPPWDMVQLDPAEYFAIVAPEISAAQNMAKRHSLIAQLSETDPQLAEAYARDRRRNEGTQKFIHASFRFPLASRGRLNLAPLFVEHDRAIIASTGRVGLVVPTGIATDSFTQVLFRSLVSTGQLVSYFGFKNEEHLFPLPVEHTVTFGLLTLVGPSARVEQMQFTWFAYNSDQMRDPRRAVHLSADDLRLLNPNSGTCPIFRTTADSELAQAIYKRVPVVHDEASGVNPWNWSGLLMFMMNSDSGMFEDREREGSVPLYEAKLFHQYNHRWATYERNQVRPVSLSELNDPSYRMTPRYWVPQAEVDNRLRGRWDRRWLMAFRDIARATDERTTIFSVIPRVAVGHTAPVAIVRDRTPTQCAALMACFNSLPLDYVSRQKVGGTHLTFTYLNQFPVLPPAAYSKVDLAFIVPRVVELTYTSWELKPFAEDLGFDDAPFSWDPVRRTLLLAELDAYFAAMYGLNRGELQYILDPQSVYGANFPGETFRVLKEREGKEYNEYRTKRLVLEAWDRLGLEPRNRDGRYEATPPSNSANGAAPVAVRAAASGTKDSAPALLSHQTVHERTRTPARTLQLPQSITPPGTPTNAVHEAVAAEPSNDAPRASRTSAPVPPAQTTLPGFSGGTGDVRQRILRDALHLLRGGGALTGRELADRLSKRDRRIDRHLVNSVLSHEGAGLVARNALTGKYSLKPS